MMKHSFVSTAQILWLYCFWGSAVESFVVLPPSSRRQQQPFEILKSIPSSRRPGQHRPIYSSSVKSAEASFQKENEKEIAESSKPDDTFVQKKVSSWTSKQPKHYDYPWTDLQEWALYDQLAKYTVQVPITNGDEKKGDSSSKLQVVTLWRTLSNEVVELSGYPLQFLVDRQMELQEQQQDTEDPSEDDETGDKDGRRRRPKLIMQTSPTILPYLDEFDFTAAGGLSGVVYGVQGLADGTRIETSPVENVHFTIPKGYVRTKDGSVLYELGRPLGTPENTAVNGGAAVAASSLTQTAKGAASSLSATAKNELDNVGPLEPELVQLGALTAMVVVGAAAFESLSHHLTVNVFWV